MNRVFQATLSALIFWVSALSAEVNIEIAHGVDTARPIGVVPFKWLGSGIPPEDIGSIVAADLRNSGKFDPFDISRLLFRPTTASEVVPEDWRALGIDSVIVGQIQPSSDNHYIISYQLVDTSIGPGSILTQNQYKVTKRWLRYAAHAASDETFERLTGIKGVFRTRIAFVVHTKSSQYPYELRIADYDGFNQILVYRSSQPLMSPAWSPDGHNLAYVTFENYHSALLLQNLYSGIVRRIANFPRHNGAPSFSPDGTKLAFALSKSGSLNLYVMDLKSNAIIQVTQNRSNNTEPAWFPDSQTLAYTSDQSGSPQIYKINISDNIPKRLSWQGNKNQDADVSADGKFIVMVSSNNSLQHITKLDLITESIQVLTDTFLDETPTIAPNGTMVIYSTSQELGSVLKLIAINGRFKTQLLSEIEEQIKFPAWSPCS